MASISIRPQDQNCANRVLRTFLWPNAQPPQIHARFARIQRIHAELQWMGFRLIEKRNNYGGPLLENGLPVAPILFWLKGRVLVRVKTRGEPASAKFRQGLAHMSVCLLEGNLHANGAMKTSYSEELGKFDPAGRLLEKGPGAAIQAAAPEYEKSAGSLHGICRAGVQENDLIRSTTLLT